MTTLRSQMHGKVHLLDAKGKRITRCGRSLGRIVEDSPCIGEPFIIESGSSHILVKYEGMDGVTCHPCRWGRDNRALPRY